MSDNNENKHSQNMSSTPNDEFLDWNDYDEEYEEEDNKNEFQNEQSNTESKSIQKKDSSEYEDDTYSDTYSRRKTNKDYTYSGSTYKKSYPSYYGNRNSFANKKYNKQSKPFNKGYDSSYYHRGTYYNRKPPNDIYNNNKEYYKYNKEHNYESKKDYKAIDKDSDYDKLNDYDRKSEKKSYGDKYYGKKNYNNYNSRFKNDYNFRNTLSYITREFNDDNKKINNKNNKFKSEFKYNKDEYEKEEEENISKPTFYNSKINNNANLQEVPTNEPKYIKIEDFIQIENLVNNINKIVRDTYINLKSKMNNNLEEQYGSLNINAKTYVPKKKKQNDK